jgi:hypothetical protein
VITVSEYSAKSIKKTLYLARKKDNFKGGITPVVKVCSYPKGFPIAKQLCPTLKPRELPIRAGLNLSPSTSTCRTNLTSKNATWRQIYIIATALLQPKSALPNLQNSKIICWIISY